MKTFMLLLCLFLLAGFTQASWKTDLSNNIQQCNILSHERHNSFFKIYIQCPYDDGFMKGITKHTVFVSKNGYVITEGF